MNKKQKLKLLSDWKRFHISSRNQYSELRRIFGSEPENSITDLTCDLLEEYTKLVSEKLGDECGWLEWFAFENDLGKKGFLVTYSDGKNSIRVKTIKDLLKVIEN